MSPKTRKVMKGIKSLFGAFTISLVLGSGLPCWVEAQTFKALHSFGPTDGVGLPTGLVLSDNNFYGTAGGGAWGYGAVFKLNTDGTGFTTLHGFTPVSTNPVFYGAGTNSDGAGPWCKLVISGNTLY